jgi:hypothetical protein
MNFDGSSLFDLSFYTLSSLLAFTILSLAYSRVRGLFGPADNSTMSLTVKWGRERFVSIFPLFDSPLTCLAFTALLLFLLPFTGSPFTRRHIRLSFAPPQPPDPPPSTRYQTLRSPTDSF